MKGRMKAKESKPETTDSPSPARSTTTESPTNEATQNPKSRADRTRRSEMQTQSVEERREVLGEQLVVLRLDIERNMQEIRTAMAACHQNSGFEGRDAAEGELRRLIVVANELQNTFQAALKEWADCGMAVKPA
jgi:hypothetical protein